MTGQPAVVVEDATGTVAEYNSEGYGFFATADVVTETHGHHNDADRTARVFFHASDVPGRSVNTDARYRFDIVKTTDGYRARKITEIDEFNGRDDGQIDTGYGQRTQSKKRFGE